MKMYWGSGSISHAFLVSALDRGKWSVSCPGKELQYPLDRMGKSQSWSGCGSEEKNPIISPAGK
jgi:hypothetical protein